MRFYVNDSSWFDSHKYDTLKIKRIVKENGGKNVRTANKFGWSNQPSVVTFNASPSIRIKIGKALNKAFKTQWIHINIKDW